MLYCKHVSKFPFIEFFFYCNSIFHSVTCVLIYTVFIHVEVHVSEIMRVEEIFIVDLQARKLHLAFGEMATAFVLRV